MKKTLALFFVLLLACSGETSAATLKNSAYGSSIALFGNTELASMASGNWIFANGGGLSTHVYDNTSGLNTFADVVCSLGSWTPSGTGPAVSLGILWSLDGTIFPDPQYSASQGTANAPLGATEVYTAGVTTTASAKVVTFRHIILYPGKAQFTFGNLSGAALAASANSCTMYPYNYTIL